MLNTLAMHNSTNPSRFNNSYNTCTYVGAYLTDA